MQTLISMMKQSIFVHKTLDEDGATKKEVIRITTDEFLQVVKAMKSELASDVFGNPNGEIFLQLC